MKSELIYLASAYSHKDKLVEQQRFEQVCRIASVLMLDGHKIFSPIAHTHPIAMAGGLPTGFDYWQAYDEAMINASKAVWVAADIDGWETSRGVSREVEYAWHNKKKVALVRLSTKLSFDEFPMHRILGC